MYPLQPNGPKRLVHYQRICMIPRHTAVPFVTFPISDVETPFPSGPDNHVVV
jgi:hypothetical protein